MSTEENLRVAERFIEAFNAHNMSQLSELFGEDVVYTNPIYPEPFKGHSAVVQYFEQVYTAYPDFRAETQHLFAQGKYFCWEGHLIGTHKGQIRDIAPTHKSVRIPLCQIGTIEGGKITRYAIYFDQLGYHAQLGLE